MNNELYTIPMPIAAAISSGRGKIFAMLFNKEIDNGHEVPVEQVKELIRLIGDLIEDNHNMKVAIHRINEAKIQLDELKTEINLCSKKAADTESLINEEIEGFIDG